jgi:anthraniloyl-CoA monooxygenase
LADPAWTLHEAAKVGFNALEWPKQYRSAKTQYESNLARAAAAVVSRSVLFDGCVCAMIDGWSCD